MNIWKTEGYLIAMQKVLCLAVFLKIEYFVLGASCVAGPYIWVNRVFLLTLALILWKPGAQRGILL